MDLRKLISEDKERYGERASSIEYNEAFAEVIFFTVYLFMVEKNANLFQSYHYDL